MRPTHALRKRLVNGKRSSQWRAVRAAHLKVQPACQACGGLEELQVHHIHPFHLHPEMELEQWNLITLCEKRGHDCHFHFGHFLNWRCWNPLVKQYAYWYARDLKKARERLVYRQAPSP